MSSLPTDEERDIHGDLISDKAQSLWMLYLTDGPEAMNKRWENNPLGFIQDLANLKQSELTWYMIKVMKHLRCDREGLKALAKTAPHARPAGAGGASSLSALLGLGYTKINPAVNQRVSDSMATVAIKNFVPPSVNDVVMSTESSGVAMAAATNVTAPSFSTSSPFMASSSSSTFVSSTSRSTPIKKKTPTKNDSKVAIKANRSSGRASRKMSPNRGNNRRGGGVNSPSRQSVLNNTSNRPPMIPVDLTGVFGSNPSKLPPKPPTSFSFGAPHPKPTEGEPNAEEQASSGFGFGAPSPVNSEWNTSEHSSVAYENALTRTNPFELLQLSDLSTNFTNLKVVERPLNGDEISQSNPLSLTCLNMIEDPKEVELSFGDARQQLGRWVKNMAKESISAPVVKFMSAVGEEVNKRRELVSKEEEVRRAAQSRLNAVQSQLSTAVRNSEMIRDNEISHLQAERDAEIQRITTEYGGYVSAAKQDHDDFVTSVSTSASESEDKYKGVIASATDNITQLNKDEKKDLTKVKAQAKVLKHSFKMFELYGQSITAKKDSQGNLSTFEEADLMKEKLLTVMHPALASGDNDRMISDILSVD